ncbi:MAG: Rieske 2Fe-2S domain-containing protein [Gammaproteobacteria bacterium]|nr:Rieske 2Fe-2S domain-containing protein [Gammaproteobacteria bacterium]
MLTAEENETLTRTGPDTLMGRVMRSYWQPALLAREVQEPGGPPVRVKILGEEFIAFRDTEGQAGLIDPRCPHRGADLFFGRNEKGGLRCAYHGWQFATSGACIDIPTSPPDIGARIKPKAAIRSLPVAERGDIIWAWMGATAPEPFPQLEFTTVPAANRYVSKKLQQCNWAQAVEGGLDTAHFSYLHAGIRDDERISMLAAGPKPNPLATGQNEPPQIASFRWMIEDSMPRFSVFDHDAGFLICAARKTDDDSQYWRCTQFLMPNHSLAPGSWPGGLQQGQTWVPIDDHHCWIYCFAWYPDRPMADDERRRLSRGFGIFAEIDQGFVPVRRRENLYLLDRHKQKTSAFTGIDGISEQDAAIADSQGYIHDRTRELLGQTDLGVVKFRRTVLAGADAVKAGHAPRGARSPAAYAVHSGDLITAAGEELAGVLPTRFPHLEAAPHHR